MNNPYGPWATAIDPGRNPQLSSFWRQRLTMLVPASQTSPVLSRPSLLGLVAAAALVLVLPTFHGAPAVAEQEKSLHGKSGDQRPDSGQNWIPDSNEIFLKKLRAKDGRFDNVSVTCNCVEIRLKSPVADYAKEVVEAGKAGKTPPPLPASLEVSESKTVTRRQLTIRNSQTTLDVHWKGPEPEAGSSKSSNASGVDQNMVSISDLRVFHTTSKRSDPNGLLQEDRMLMELSLGAGYGKRILSIEKVTRDGTFAVVEATMRLWSEDITQAHLKLDDHFLVREATLLADMKGDKTEFKISTKGLTEAQKDRQIAASGELKRTALTAMVDGKEIKMRKDDIRDHFQIRIVKVQYDLDDATYRQLIDLHPASATHVVDFSKP